jgi:hypothetical protein
VVAVLRPEQLTVIDPRSVDDAHARGGLGTVISVSYHGHDSLLHVRLATGVEIAIRVSGESVALPGETVRVVANGVASIFPA